MNQPQRGMSKIVVPEEISAPDPVSLGALTVVAGFEVTEVPRGGPELARSLSEVPVNSAQDICKQFGVTIRGGYTDATGEAVQVALPVAGEEDFSVDGLTRLDPCLAAMHVRARAYDECARYLSDKKRERLEDDEVAHLETIARILEDAEKESDHE